MVDPANACQLGCPGCVHSTNQPWVRLYDFDWPRETLSVQTYDAFLENFGPFAISAVLYNYGEPLLNKRFHEIVRSSKDWLLYTMTSTNLSMPLHNAQAIVASGLDYMILSIDGTTQSVYEMFRRNGDLALVLENVRKLVSAKRSAGSTTPYLVWQFLTFEHNQHQTEEAIRMAKELGVNQINVVTPFEVNTDAPSIHAVKSPYDGEHIFEGWDRRWFTPTFCTGMKSRAKAIDAAFSKSWQMRFYEASRTDSSAPEAGTCWWLYYNVTLDGAGRIMPCCMVPFRAETNKRNLVFADFKYGQQPSALEIINSPMAVMARESFVDRPGYERNAASCGANGKPYCAECSEKPVPPYSMLHVREEIRTIDWSCAIPADVIDSLTAWHTVSSS
jgi:MoaA/NifB/PqqE/SkfB family radical SAM enzyme